MEQKMTWTLADDGDAIERRWSSDILPTFPKYEEFWREHIVPLTFRMKNRELLYVRAGLSKELRNLATAHYSVFLRLSFAAETLKESQLHKLSDVYHFYVDLYGAFKDMLERFLRATQNALKKYGHPMTSNIDRRMLSWRDTGLLNAYKRSREELGNYRHLIHDPVMIMLSGHLPRPEKINKNDLTYRDLAELAKFLTVKDAAQKEFVDAYSLGSDQFGNCTSILNRIWFNVIEDFRKIATDPKYISDQAAESDEDRFFLECVSDGKNINILGGSAPVSGYGDWTD